ncbi:MAG: geranylgeranylglycerol-phosphate geranylgeranyltransferase [Bacteroidota bacterium]
MIHLIRLFRPVNLIIIAGTMYSLGAYFDRVVLKTSQLDWWQSFDFFLLVFSTVLIAAAGNIINDYFDVRADRVNRPGRLVITKHVKRRWAIVLHWTLNLIAFLMAAYLSYRNRTFWYVFIHLFSINLLWFYSMQLKRTLVIGNVVIALLTSLVPVLVGIFYDENVNSELVSGNIFPFENVELKSFFITFGAGLGAFAFLLNWIREIVKDIEDMEGDHVIRARTIPIFYGVKRAKYMALLLILLTMLASLAIFYGYKNGFIPELWPFSPLLLSAVTLIAAAVFLLRSKDSKDYRYTNMLVKITMIAGMLLPLFWIVSSFA